MAVVATAIAMTTLMVPAVLAPQAAQAALPAPAKPSTSKASTTAAANPGKAATAADKARAAARKATVAAGAAAAAAATTLALASDEQRHAYTLAHLGEYQCEFKRMIRVLAHPRQEGYVDLHFDKQVVTARPVLSSTGAVRLEDVKGRYLMVQIAFKSMLMDTKLGQRVADECLHDAHHDARRAAAEAPPAEGLGITGPGPTN
jgi:membrane-bound inhibitor of C-type lysozyme